MKANAWIKTAKLNKMAEELRAEREYDNFAIGELFNPRKSKTTQVAISLGRDEPDLYFPKGMNKQHSFYYDTGNGYRQTRELITITGMLTVGKEGEFKTSGKVDMNARTTLMVFK